MGAYRTVRKVVTFLVALAMVSSVAVAPALADDGLLGDDGDVLSGGDDLLNETDDILGTSEDDPDADGDVSVDLGTDDQSVEVGGSGSDGSSSAGVECEVTAETRENPCETSGGAEDGGLPVDPGGDGLLPTDPSLPSNPEDPGLPVNPDDPGLPTAPDGVGELPGGSSTVIQQTGNGGYVVDEEVGDGDVQAGVMPGGRAVEQVGVRVAGYGSDQGQLDQMMVMVGPDDGTATVDTMGTSGERELGTTLECNAGAGVINICTVTNSAPVDSGDVPQDSLPALPEDAPVSYGLLFLAADSAVQQPQALTGLAAQQIGANTPEESPFSINNPPYNVDALPFDPTRPEETINPTASPTASTQNGDITRIERGGELSLTDDVGGSGLVVFHQSDSITGVGAGMTASDGQNDYAGVVDVSSNGVYMEKEGFVGGNLTLSQNEQSGGGEIDLGGQPYGMQFPSEGDSGGPGGLPVDPSQAPSPPTDSLPVDSVPLPDDPSLPPA